MPGKLPLRDAPSFAFRRSRKGTIGSHGNRISRSPEKRAVRMVIAISGIENPAARAEALIGELAQAHDLLVAFHGKPLDLAGVGAVLCRTHARRYLKVNRMELHRAGDDGFEGRRHEYDNAALLLLA